jgi:hypothetical protein
MYILKIQKRKHVVKSIKYSKSGTFWDFTELTKQTLKNFNCMKEMYFFLNLKRTKI